MLNRESAGYILRQRRGGSRCADAVDVELGAEAAVVFEEFGGWGWGRVG